MLERQAAAPFGTTMEQTCNMRYRQGQGKGYYMALPSAHVPRSNILDWTGHHCSHMRTWSHMQKADRASILPCQEHVERLKPGFSPHDKPPCITVLHSQAS